VPDITDTSAVRRIFLEGEAEQIFKLQATASVFKRHYPEHAKWLRMAINEIREGKRFAFGVYVPEVRGGRADLKLAGSIILKSESYSKVMQLKNLYIDEGYRRKHFGAQLFSAVERFCIKRGSTAIDTEVPVEEKSTVAFLNSVGFLVHAHLDSPYRRGDVLYRMYKPLPRMYTRDPFDLTELTAWTLDVGLGFRIDHIAPEKIEFSRQISADGRMPRENEDESLSLTGTAYISDQEKEIDSAQLKALTEARTKRRQTIIIVSGRRFSDGAQKLAARNRIHCFSRKDLDTALSTAYPFVPPTFDRENIGGILAPIKSAYLGALQAAPSQEKTYFKGGPVGKFLTPGNTIFFYVESDTAATGAILAKATIRDAKAGSPTAVWEQSETRNPVFLNRSEYEAWSSDKTEVVALTYSALERVQPLPRPLLQALRTLERLEDDQVGTFYLSIDDVAELTSKCQPLSPQTDGKPDLATAPKGVSDSLRTRLTNGEVPQFSYLPPPPPNVTAVDAERTTALMRQTKVLLLTAAQIELDTTLSMLEPSDGTSICYGYKGQAVYYFGRLGLYEVAVAKCKAGSARRDGAAMTVQQAISDCNPIAVIAVGVAFGGYTSHLKIGDVLLSEQVISYDIKRASPTGDVYRGPIPEAGPILLNRFSNALGWEFKRPDGYSCKVKPGPLLSGETLLDNLEEKVSLFSHHPTAIGGEMEATGIYAAAARHDTSREWIIVKSICDWADGTKSVHGDAYQPLAAAASLSLVRFVLSIPNGLTALSLNK
jgi:nucleoside phosphorylase/ribosomal protein S18 acetylase RimI-like enzyme